VALALIALVALAVAAVLVLRGRQSAAPLVLASPRLALLNLAGAPAAPLLVEDRAALVPLLGPARESDGPPPRCDVLFLYCEIEPDGQVRNSSLGLRELIRETGAKIVVVASENDAARYILAGRQVGYGRANLVMTLARNGPAFTRFFRRLFEKMLAGATMPMAWVQLAPQAPGPPRQDVPSTIFACELGQIVFARRDR